MTKTDQLITWLRDAYAMEVGIVTNLEKHTSDAKGLPKVRGPILKHLGQTKAHAVAVKKCLQSLGADSSVLKSGVSKLTSLIAGLPTSLVEDTVIKNAIAEFATENFEIACYSSLIETANILRLPTIASACKKILAEEKAQAKLLDGQLKELTSQYIDGLDDDTEEETEPEKAPKAKKKSPARR